MDKVIGYIFKNLDKHDVAIDNLSKRLTKVANLSADGFKAMSKALRAHGMAIALLDIGWVWSTVKLLKKQAELEDKVTLLDAQLLEHKIKEEIK